MADHGMGPQGVPEGSGTCRSTLTLATLQHLYHLHLTLSRLCLLWLWLSHTLDCCNERIPACPHFLSLTTCPKCAFPSQPGSCTSSQARAYLPSQHQLHP